MYNDYQFCEENAGHLQRFLDAVAAHPTPENKWNSYFTAQRTSATPAQTPIIEIDPSPSDVSTGGYSNSILVGNENSLEEGKNENLFEEGKDLCEFVEYACKEENYSLCETVLEKCSKNYQLLVYLAANLSESAATKFLQYVHEKKPSKDFIKQIFLYFLLHLIKSRPHTRFIDNIVLQSYQEFPEVFLDTFLQVLLNEPSISGNVFDHYVKSLSSDAKKIILNEIFSSMFASAQFLVHIPAILGLFKAFNDPFLNSSMVKLLSRHSEVGCNDKNYGKLLLAVIQSGTNPTSHFDVLESLCLVHQTVFKKACLNALNKLKN